MGSRQYPIICRLRFHFVPTTMAEAWDGTLEEWVVSEGYCAAAAMAQQTDGQWYAAAPVAGDAGWGMIYKEDHEQDILQEDGVTTKKMTINEGWQIQQLITTGKTPPGVSGLLVRSIQCLSASFNSKWVRT